MKRPLKPEELRVWGLVAATVHPLPGRETPKPELREAIPAARATPRLGAMAKPVGKEPRQGVDRIEPGRRRRIVKDRDLIGARLDLHGFDQDRARTALEAFLHRAWDEGYRAVLVITGKGVQGDGVLRRRTPEWLAAPHLAQVVAGISEAHRRHGGEGALYVALKRKPRG